MTQSDFSKGTLSQPDDAVRFSEDVRRLAGVVLLCFYFGGVTIYPHCRHAWQSMI